MREPFPITLSDDEAKEAVKVGEIRRGQNLSGYKTRGWQGKDALILNDIMGSLAECAIRKSLGLPTRPKVLHGRGDGGKNDIVLSTGESISVKSSRRRYPTTHFWYQEPATLRDDFGVLVVPDKDDEEYFDTPWEMRSFLVLGYITKDDYEEKKHSVPVPYGECSGVRDDEMYDYEWLLDAYRLAGVLNSQRVFIK